MKNKKILSLGLIKEGIRQTRAVGIAYLCISLLVSLFRCVGYITDALDKTYNLYSSITNSSGAIGFTAILGLYIVLPVLTLMMFNFLNSRSASDYYHSIPKTRLQTVLSFTVSVAFWYFLADVAVMVIEVLIGLICGMNVDLVSLGMHILNDIAIFMHLYGILLLAMSLATGILNQIAAAGIIAFMPRILLAILQVISENAAPVLMDLSDSLGKFGDTSFNLLFHNELFTGTSIFDNEDFAVLLYSVALGLIYGTLGVVCFCKRKSEAATSAGANKYVQCAIRVLVAFVVCLIPCTYMGLLLISDEILTEDIIYLLPTIILFYGIALVVYYLYEAIAAKKIKGVVTLKGTMGIGLIALAVLNVVFIVAPTVIANAALSADINTDNVASISLYEDDNYYGTDYASLGINEIKFDNEEVVAALCTALEKDIEAIEKGNYSSYFNRQDMTCVQISFNMKDGRVLNRNVYLPIKDYSNVMDEIEADKEYIKMLRRLPSLKEATDCYLNSTGLSDKRASELYETLCSELSAMTDDEYIEYKLDDVELWATYLDAISISGYKNNCYWSSSYNINIMVPKTFAQFIKLCNENNDFDEASFAEYFANSDETHVTVTLIDPNDPKGSGDTWFADFTDEEPTKEMLEVTEKLQEYWGKPVDSTAAFYKVEYFIDDYDMNTKKDTTWVSGVYFIPADDELVEFMKNYE